MNKQFASAIAQRDESTNEVESQNEVLSLDAEMLSIVAGGEGMICIG
ncbi:MAG TPA: hypothetical protein VFJ86_07005 [Usitatibacter sp.]|jgi:hypothetical protein|nr:hypothetical protein [Usitatibacter sp.]